MAKISLKFTHKDGKFCLCAHVKGTQVRHYKVVSVLKNPNFSKWNPQAQMFISKVENDLQNNYRQKLPVTILFTLILSLNGDIQI